MEQAWLALGSSSNDFQMTFAFELWVSEDNFWRASHPHSPPWIKTEHILDTMTSDWSAACHFTKHQMLLQQIWHLVQLKCNWRRPLYSMKISQSARFGGASIYKPFSGAAAANLTLLWLSFTNFLVNIVQFVQFWSQNSGQLGSLP